MLSQVVQMHPDAICLPVLTLIEEAMEDVAYFQSICEDFSDKLLHLQDIVDVQGEIPFLSNPLLFLQEPPQCLYLFLLFHPFTSELINYNQNDCGRGFASFLSQYQSLFQNRSSSFSAKCIAIWILKL